MISGIQGGMEISADMIQQRQEEMFSKIDQNGDGSIDKSEFQVMSEKMSEMSGQSIDFEEVFSEIDTDGNGQLSLEEMESFRPPRPPQGMGMDMNSQDQSATYQNPALGTVSTDLTGELLDILG